MFVVNDDMSIYVTRGDVVNLTITAEDRYGNPHQFSAGDVLRFTVVEKKACENVFLQKCFGVEAPTASVEIFLSEADTKFGDVISKPTDYWYEVELNPFTNPETIIGYDVDGPRVFKLFPEGADIDVTPIEPSEIPIVDSKLNVGSQRPVQNQAVARAILDIKAKMHKVIVDVPKEGWSASAPYTITLPVEGLDVDSDIIFNLEPAGEVATENEIISVGYITDINVGIDSITIVASSLPLVSYSIKLRSNVLNGETTAKGGGTSVSIGEVTLLSSDWQGEGYLYSQVVNVVGVTENSQVDLTPSVEQLVSFYEKDISFVTENEGGVVTVYAIGQKPLHDYTIQVTITEVL